MIAAELAESDDFAKSDVQYFRTLLTGAIDNAGRLEAEMQPFLDRRVGELSPVERGILLLGGYELLNELEVPYRVVINEAVELAKAYGGTDGHKFVNGVLDKLAERLRGRTGQKIDRSTLMRLLLEQSDLTADETADQLASLYVRRLVSQLTG